MTIQELAKRAAVTTRTIRYYVEQGVLPPPERGRPAEYTDEHVRLLDLVRRLKEQYLPLEEIRDMLQRLTPEQVEELLRRTGPPTQGPPPQDSAANYISRVLSRGVLRHQLKAQAAEPPAATPPPAAPAPPTRGVSLPRHRSPAVPEAVETSHATVDEGSAGTDFEGQSAVARATLSQREPRTGEERTWQRVYLAPGVELHYETVTSSGRKNAIEQLIEAARTILGSHPEKGTEEQR